MSVQFHVVRRQAGHLPDDMIRMRNRSGISGPLSFQNPRSQYCIQQNSLHLLATCKEQLVGYMVGRLYETSSAFGGRAYFPSSIQKSDTLVVNEIAVDRDNQGQGIAGQLLDMAVHSTRLENVQCTVLSSNLASENLFANFAKRNGQSITIHGLQKSDYGNYIDWTIELGKDKNLHIKSDISGIFNFDAGLIGYRDRMGVIGRLRSQL